MNTTTTEKPLVHAIMSEEAYESVMWLIGELTCDEKMQWVFDERPELGGFFDGYGIHARDCCSAFDNMLKDDGYVKENNGGVHDAK